MIGAALLAAAALTTGDLFLGADAATTRGYIALQAVTVTEQAPEITFGEGERVLGTYPTTFARTEPTGDVYAALLPYRLPWRCDRQERTFWATAPRVDGTVARSEFSVRTPSCRNRLTAARRRGRLVLTDTWDSGRLRARVCAPRCRTVRFVDGESRRLVALRGRGRVVVRTAHQRLVVGARARGGPKLLVTGDSLMQNVDTILSDRLARRARVVTDVRLGSGLTRGDYLAEARAQVARDRPNATLIFLGVNDGYAIGANACCGDAWAVAYEARVAEAMDVYAQDGAGRVLWLTVPAQRDPRRNESQVVVNRAIRRAAASRPEVRVIAADELFTPGGRYRDEIDGVRVREGDGIHLSLAGARIAARRLMRSLRRLRLL